jgi:hypothetical protein
LDVDKPNALFFTKRQYSVGTVLRQVKLLEVLNVLEPGKGYLVGALREVEDRLVTLVYIDNEIILTAIPYSCCSTKPVG